MVGKTNLRRKSSCADKKEQDHRSLRKDRTFKGKIDGNGMERLG